MNRVLIGVGAGAAIALVVLFVLLMRAQEEKGRIASELDEAVRANESQTEKIELLEQEKQDAQERFERERERADQFVIRIAESERQLETQKREFRAEIQNVRNELTVEELECADQHIPLAYFGGVREGEGSNPD